MLPYLQEREIYQSPACKYKAALERSCKAYSGVSSLNTAIRPGSEAQAFSQKDPCSFKSWRGLLAFQPGLRIPA